MTARRIMWPLTVLLTLAVVALAVPASPFYLSNMLASGWHFNGRSTASWMRALESEDPAERDQAIFALGAIGPAAEEAVPVLAKLMIESPDSHVRNQAALAISKMTPASRLAIPELASALSDKDHWVRMNAALALSRLKDKARPAIPELVQALKDMSNNTNLGHFNITIQQVAALALGRTSSGDAAGIAALTDALGKGYSEYVRWSAVEALGEIGPEARAAVPQIQDLLKHPRPEMREAAAEALRRIEAGS
jgi:HEAT repeat protein